MGETRAYPQLNSPHFCGGRVLAETSPIFVPLSNKIIVVVVVVEYYCILIINYCWQVSTASLASRANGMAILLKAIVVLTRNDYSANPALLLLGLGLGSGTLHFRCF